MQEDGAIDAEQMRQASASVPRMAAFERRAQDSGFYFLDQLRREAKAAAEVDLLTGGSYTIRSTINPRLQRATETALQDGLTRYEMNHGRAVFQGAEVNLSSAVRRQEAKQHNEGSPPAWQKVLAGAHLMLYDVHWTPAIIIELANKKSGNPRVGLADGRTLPLNVRVGKAQRALKLHDVVYVKVIDGPNKGAARTGLRVPPTVQGAGLVLEDESGRSLAMAGGSAFPLSQLNRTTQAQRQPGSAIKPLTYLAALQAGLQPNALVPDESITLPPIGGVAHATEKDYWSPKNYEGASMG